MAKTYRTIISNSSLITGFEGAATNYPLKKGQEKYSQRDRQINQL